MATFTSIDNDFLGSAGFFTQEHLIAQYQAFHSRNRYFYTSGLEMMPVAATNPLPGLPVVSQRVVQLAQPFGYRVYSWAVQREAKKPLLPHPAPQNPLNEVLLSARVCPKPPEVDASSSVHTYFVEGVYVYGLLQPILNGIRYVTGLGLVGDQLRMGATPYDVTPADDNVYTPDDFTPMQ